MHPYPLQPLLALVESLFQAEGLHQEQAQVVARGFLEADLLGFHTHGLARVPANLEWLRAGETETAGEPVVLVDRPAVANWDAHRLPGHWAMHRAMQHAVRQARAMGAFSMTLRRCQHVACLASTLIPARRAISSMSQIPTPTSISTAYSSSSKPTPCRDRGATRRPPVASRDSFWRPRWG